MSESIFETSTDERGNISVRVSQEVQVLTREEADRIEAEYKRMRAENAKLRKLVAQRTAKCVVVSNHETDHATGHCACGACGGAIDFFDTYCRHCGAKLEEDE